MESLQESLNDSGPGQTTPERQKAAIRHLEKEGGLSDDEFIDAVCLIQEKPGIATAYLAINKDTSRTLFMKKQLSKLRSAE
jgi:hypothetical protein